MKTRPLAIAAAIAAAVGGGYVARGPGEIGINDAIEVKVYSDPAWKPGEGKPAEGTVNANADVVPNPEDTPTPVPEPLAHCPHTVVAMVDTRDLQLLFGSPEEGYWIPPGTIDPRVVDGQDLIKKAGTMELYANVRAEVFDEDGRLRDVRQGPNTIVSAGKELALQMLVGDDAGNCPTTVVGGCGINGSCTEWPKFNWVAIGTSATAPSTGQTALIGEVGTRVHQTAPSVSGGTATVIASFAADNAANQTLNESGLFTASSNGTMLARKTFGGSIAKGASDVVQITWTLNLN